MRSWRRIMCFSAAALVLAAVANASSMVSAADAPPSNIIVILADDMGLGDYSAYGTPDLRTPHIDRLAREGLTFTNFYANSCVCSPTRAALLTGCYPDRVGVPGVIRHVPADNWGRLAPGAVMLPQVLKTAGYHTALVGKWHLGLESPDVPNERGFDFFHGFLGDMMDDYRTHLRGGRNFMRRNTEEIAPRGTRPTFSRSGPATTWRNERTPTSRFSSTSRTTRRTDRFNLPMLGSPR
ncbi:MAG: sulfatase-like hydrolase/transferase [Pirellulales bacterium]